MNKPEYGEKTYLVTEQWEGYYIEGNLDEFIEELKEFRKLVVDKAQRSYHDYDVVIDPSRVKVDLDWGDDNRLNLLIMTLGVKETPEGAKARYEKELQEWEEWKKGAPERKKKRLEEEEASRKERIEHALSMIAMYKRDLEREGYKGE